MRTNGSVCDGRLLGFMCIDNALPILSQVTQGKSTAMGTKHVCVK